METDVIVNDKKYTVLKYCPAFASMLKFHFALAKSLCHTVQMIKDSKWLYEAKKNSRIQVGT